MIKAGNQLLMIFRDYRNNICLIITNSENANNKIKEEIELIFKKKFGIDKILFSSLKNGGLELRNFCDKLENYKNQMKSIEKLIIKTSDLTQTICPEYDFEVMEERDKYVQEFQKALKIFNNEFNKSNNKELKRALYFGLRDYKESLIINYNEIIKNKKNDFYAVITELIMFNNTIFYEYNEFKKKVELELNAEIKRYGSEENVKYKKCPYCGRIWCQVYGSPFSICGKRTSLKDLIWEKYKTYFVSYINGILDISCKEEEQDYQYRKEPKSPVKGLREEEIQKNLNRNNGQVEIKPEGCGNKLIWNDCEDVTEFVINSLKQINDNYAGIITDIANDVNLLIQNEKYEDALNAIFSEKTTDFKKIDEKKELLKKILEKLPELDKKAKELSKLYNFNLF